MEPSGAPPVNVLLTSKGVSLPSDLGLRVSCPLPSPIPPCRVEDLPPGRGEGRPDTAVCGRPIRACWGGTACRWRTWKSPPLGNVPLRTAHVAVSGSRVNCWSRGVRMWTTRTQVECSLRSPASTSLSLYSPTLTPNLPNVSLSGKRMN